jgi:SAM-dependent methyltransferase
MARVSWNMRRPRPDGEISVSRRFAPEGPIRALAYRLLWSSSHALVKGSNACLYLAAGLLRERDLDAASQIRWRESVPEVDDVDYGLDVWEQRIYGELLTRSDRVLLVGCGSGRDLIPLVELGYNVTGLDPVPELVDLAKTNLAKRGLSAPVHAGFVETWDMAEPFDVVLFSGACYSYVRPSALRVETLRRIKARLSQKGRIIINYMGLVQQSRLSTMLTRLSAQLSRADWRPEPGDCFSRDHRVQPILRCEHLFRPGEVASECQLAGLRVTRDQVRSGPFYCAVAVC